MHINETIESATLHHWSVWDTKKEFLHDLHSPSQYNYVNESMKIGDVAPYSKTCLSN
jgi:hypothetical protein